MKHGFIPIRLDDYVAKFLKANPSDKRDEVVARLREAMEAYSRDERCNCGEKIWVIGSAETGSMCFTCITGESTPDNDYELDTACS